MKYARIITALFAIILLSLVATPTRATESVSPGAVDRMAVVETRCPTFSWGMSGDAAGYDLVAYVLPEDVAKQAEFTAKTEVLYTRVAGSATSWTPSADQCFAPGGRYVWFVRTVTELVDDQVIVAGEWSAGRYFTVPAAPSAEEMQRALDVLKRWEATNGDGSRTLFAAAGAATVPDADSDADAGWALPKSVPTASAAIRGEHPDTSGEKYGVVGTTESTDGAGVAAANLGSGPDLVLDGSVNGAADTRISEAVLERSSPSDQTFLFHNGGGGLLNVIAHGSLTGDAFKVQYGTVIDDDGNWLGVGDTVPCPGCVGSSDIADGGVDTADLAAGAVTAVKLAAGAVGASAIRSNAVTNTHLADAAVTGVEILDGTITAADIEGGGLYSAKDQLYERQGSISISILGVMDDATTVCDDENDLPIAGSCAVNSNTGLALVASEAVAWASVASAAEWVCNFRNTEGGTHTGYARILCISVP